MTDISTSVVFRTSVLTLLTTFFSISRSTWQKAIGKKIEFQLHFNIFQILFIIKIIPSSYLSVPYFFRLTSFRWKIAEFFQFLFFLKMILVNIPFALGWYLLWRATEIWEIFCGFAMLGAAIGLMEAGKCHDIELCWPLTLQQQQHSYSYKTLQLVQNIYSIFFQFFFSKFF